MAETSETSNPDDSSTLSVTSLEVTLRIGEDLEKRYNGNPENRYKIDEIKQMLSNGRRIAYFQKQKSDDHNNRSRHKIILPIGNDRAVEASVTLQRDKVDAFTDIFSYRVVKFKEVSFFVEPTKQTIKKDGCSFKFSNLDEKAGTGSEDFKALYRAVDSCEIPPVDINKEKDQKIWANYVLALKKLVKQKEQVWKI
ncbi:MAG TPA: hypothetical protein VFU05_16055, partial [Cyclobacteriaceae bacterium]|nr:hypothetical protein [Cyclobacteriaceae bacterium]